MKAKQRDLEPLLEIFLISFQHPAPAMHCIVFNLLHLPLHFPSLPIFSSPRLCSDPAGTLLGDSLRLTVQELVSTCCNHWLFQEEIYQFQRQPGNRCWVLVPAFLFSALNFMVWKVSAILSYLPPRRYCFSFTNNERQLTKHFRYIISLHYHYQEIYFILF